MENKQNIMENKQNLRNICQRFFDYGMINSDIIGDDLFDMYYQSEFFDSFGSLYLLEVQYYFDEYDQNFREIFSNILLTNYTEALDIKNKLLQLIEFAKNFVKNTQNGDRYDMLEIRNLDYVLTDEEYEFMEEFDYMRQISLYEAVNILCLQISNNDWKFDKYFDKNLNT